MPDDNIERVLTSVDAVSYAFSSTEPVWDCTFVEYNTRKLIYPRSLVIRLGGSIIRAAVIGSVWKNRKNVAFVGNQWPYFLYGDLLSDPLEQTVLYRTDLMSSDGQIIGSNFYDEFVPGARPYILVKLLGEFAANYALFSSFEIYRYYIGYLPSVSRHFFNFDALGNNDALFVAKNTYWSDVPGVYRIDPKPAITDQDQKRIAHYLGSQSARKSIGLAAASARAQFSRNQKVLPVNRFPIVGINKWSVVGGIRKFFIEINGSVELFEVLAVSRILNCYDKPRVSLVESTREKLITTKSYKRIEEDKAYFTSNYEDTKEIPVTSAKPSGGLVKVSTPDLDADSFVRESWSGTSYIRVGVERDKVSLLRDYTSVESINELSTQMETGGKSDVGQLDDTTSGLKELKPVFINEEHYRSQFEHIFAFQAPGSITAENIEVSALPDSLHYMFDSARQYLDGDGGRSGHFLGTDIKEFYSDVVPIFHLNPNWGKATRYRLSPKKVRRALVLEIPVNNGYVYFFDVEKKKGEKISMHVMLFNGRSLSYDQIASVFYRRLEGQNKGWPERKQYAGEFWSSKLYHYTKISDTVKGNLMWKCIEYLVRR